MRIEEIFPEGHWESEEEYRIRCPICGDNSDKDDKHNCAINVVKRTFHCWFGECKGNLRDLLRKKYSEEEIISAPAKKSKTIVPIDFSEFLPVTGKREGVMDEMALGYLKNRGIILSDVRHYDIRYSSKDTFFGRIIVPIKENDKMVCFVGRDYIGSKLKYLYPKRGETPLSISKVVFNLESAIRENAKNVVITEGVFDSMAIDKINGLRGVALLGHNLSKIQLIKLLKLPITRFFVCMDADMHKETVNIVKRLSDQGRIARAVLLREGDPASISKEELIKSLKSAEQYSYNLESRIMRKNKNLEAKKLQD